MKFYTILWQSYPPMTAIYPLRQGSTNYTTSVSRFYHVWTRSSVVYMCVCLSVCRSVCWVQRQRNGFKNGGTGEHYITL